MSQRNWTLVSILALLLGSAFWACDKGEDGEITSVEEGETPTEAAEEPEPPAVPEPSAQVPSEPEPPTAPTEPAAPAVGATGACATLATCCEALVGRTHPGMDDLLSSCSAMVESGVADLCRSMKQQVDATLSVAGPDFGAIPEECR